MARKAEELLPLKNLPPMLVMSLVQCFLRLTKRFHIAILTRMALRRLLPKNLPRHRHSEITPLAVIRVQAVTLSIAISRPVLYVMPWFDDLNRQCIHPFKALQEHTPAKSSF